MARRTWRAPQILRWRRAFARWRDWRYSGIMALLAGSGLITLLIMISKQVLVLPGLGEAFIPLIAMLAYYWGWRLGLAGCALQLLCVYFLLLPSTTPSAMRSQEIVDMLVLAAISVYVLLLVQLARSRRDAAERETSRFAALNTVGTALAGELHESQLLDLIARTACDLTGAGFAAFTLRPTDALGRPVGPAEGSYFHLAAVVGVTPEQEALFRRVPLGGEGLLAPIFRYGVLVRIDDVFTLPSVSFHGSPAHTSGNGGTGRDQRQDHHAGHLAGRESRRDVARRYAEAYAHGNAATTDLRTIGIPRGHPVVRSFLGAPLLDREGAVRGGLLLGHVEPERFTKDDEALLRALAAQAAVALENARLYRRAQSQAEELNAVFESISDGVMVLDQPGKVLHENRAALAIRETLAGVPENPALSDVMRSLPDDAKASGDHNSADAPIGSMAISLADEQGETREYVVSASPLRQVTPATDSPDGPLPSAPAADDDRQPKEPSRSRVVVWHEVTETRKLLAEQQARAEAETRRLLLQGVIDELPSGVYLVRGRDAKLVLANQAAQEVWGAHWAVGQTMADFLATSGTQIVGIGGRPLAADELATVRALRTGEAMRHYEEVIHRPNSTSLPVLLNAVALDPQVLPLPLSAAAAGQRSSPESVALVVLQDVTAIKDAERLKDEFIAIAAHELKTPMAAVKGYADMLVRHAAQEDATPLDPWQVEALETIDLATNRLVELTDDLLDVARLQAERLRVNPEPHDLTALVRRVMKRFQLASEHHTLSLVAPENFVVAVLDVRRTEQIVGNLLSNALKYSPGGGPVTLTISQLDTEQFTQLAVRDEGIGIPVSQQGLLFNRFARAENARERGIAGTGLGLYLCRELAELQGGHLWFESEEGHGSTFYLTLPSAVEIS
jgi:two-component system, OmpR family, phosphate regulon sensor histidine kinase PhoR